MLLNLEVAIALDDGDQFGRLAFYH